MILDGDTVLLDVVDPEKKRSLDDGAEPGDIWHDDDDDDAMETEDGIASSFLTC